MIAEATDVCNGKVRSSPTLVGDLNKTDFQSFQSPCDALVDKTDETRFTRLLTHLVLTSFLILIVFVHPECEISTTFFV